VKPRALFLHGGPGLNDYLDSFEVELADVFAIERYEQAKHHDVPAFVAEAVEHLAEPAWLVGHSWGGRLAFEIAARAPDGVLGVVAVGSLGALGLGGWDETEPRMLERLTDEERTRLEAAGPGEGLRIVWPAYFSSRAVVPPFPEGLRGDGDVLESIYAWISEHGGDPTVADGLRGFARPVLAIHGELDAIPLAGVEETVALLPDAELVVLDGVAHFPWDERPGSVREVVVDFLSRRSS
jgi:proline iminopeptidase